MAENTKIEWCHDTVNFWWGCAMVSAACMYCYALNIARVFSCGKATWGEKGKRWIRYNEAMRELLKINRKARREGARRRVFINSMSDTFEDRCDLDVARFSLFQSCEIVSNLDIILLTKRPENVMNMVPVKWLNQWPAHVWIGTTVENQEMADKRIPELLKIPARVRFLSCEPLLGPVDLRDTFEVWEYCSYCGKTFDYVEGRDDVCPSCKKKGCMSAGYGNVVRELYEQEGGIHVDDGSPIHWVICGGESGPRARPMHPDWARSLRDQCAEAGVPFFFKQWGEWVPWGINCCDALNSLTGDDVEKRFTYTALAPYVMYRVGKHTAGCLLDGKEHKQFPEVKP